jgi:NADPH-dependent 7-cyano-7-deazaguanine reductase QueF
MIIHTSMIHGRCPINGNWDYYTVEIRTDDFVDVADLECVLNDVRGSKKTQEDIAFEIREKVPAHCIVVLRGRHSQNTETMVEL